MNQNYNQESFNKGQAFEDYVEQILFPKTHFTLEHKTNSYDQNKQRYVGDSRKPDFRFKCILTGFEFHIEAKYRTKPYQGYYDILSPSQVKTFSEIHEKEYPIYIALGYGGQADDPSYVSLIPYENNREGKISIEEATVLHISKQAVDSSSLYKSQPQEEKPLEETGVNSHIQNSQPEVKVVIKEQTQPKQKKRRVVLVLMGILISLALIAAVFQLPTSEEDGYKLELKTRIKKYYALSDANNLKELRAFISPEMTNWYGIENPSTEEVINNIKEYRTKFPFSESRVDWKTFDVTEREEGGYNAIYPLEYKVKSKMKSPYKAYDLKVLTIWDSNMRLISITEIRY